MPTDAKKQAEPEEEAATLVLLAVLKALAPIAPPYHLDTHDGDTMVRVLKAAAAYYGRGL